MPYILGTVTEMTENNDIIPCMDFQVQCLNKPITITSAPPHFWVTVPQDEYVMQVTAASGATATAVATVLTTFGGVRLKIVPV
jgi:hypothetical protein